MKKATLNAWVDAVAFVALVLLVATGSLIKFVLPPGSGHFSAVWGMDRHQWGDVHFYIAVLLGTAMVVHVYLHWGWVVAMVRGRTNRGAWRVALAVLGLCLLGGVAAAPFLSVVEQISDAPHRGRAARGAEPAGPSATAETRQGAEPRAVRHAEGVAPSIDGTMSLREVERRTGVPASIVLKELGLPANVPVDERLGRLRKQYGFDMHALREVVERHQAKTVAE